MTKDIIAIIGTGVALAGLIIGGQYSTNARIDRLETRLDARINRLEDKFDLLREAIFNRNQGSQPVKLKK